MRLILLVTLTMIAFAANSVLNRLAVAEFGMDALGFAVLRVGARAVTLLTLVWLRDKALLHIRPCAHWRGALALATYMIGFSYAYQTLEAGLGALILFGVLQLLLFGWAVASGQAVRGMQWVGMSVALAGLTFLLWPSETVAIPVGGTMAMLIAAAGWVAYTVLGRGAADALAGSAQNFALCLPLVLFPFAFDPSLGGGWAGLGCAILSGAVTSGLGYALWYRVLPQLVVTQASLAQLSVPVFAVLGGAVILLEPITARMIFAACVILGGIALASAPKAPADRS